MYQLITGDDATEDLEALLLAHPKAAYRMIALLDELANDQDLLDRLTQHGYGGTPYAPADGAVINIGKWVTAQQKGMNLWRMRDFELSNMGYEYRIIYAYHPPKDQYFVLAIVQRGFNYDDKHPITQRIFAAYRLLEQDGW